MCRFKGECAHFSFNKCLIYNHDGASAKFSTNSQEIDNSVCSGGGGGGLFTELVLILCSISVILGSAN